MPEGMRCRMLALDDQGMAGVVAPVEPDDDIGVLRVQIDNFSLPLVTPLGSHNHHVCHTDISPNTLLIEKPQGFSTFPDR
jgi:hypothetical protein